MADPIQVSQAPWSTRRLLAWTTEYFKKKGLHSPRLSAEMLLAHVLGTERLKLYMDADRPANELERSTFRNLIERAAGHEPIEYLVGKCPFFSMVLSVNHRVMIPRPSTESVVEHVVQHARRTPGFHAPLIADIGAGSGAIAIALAKHVPSCRVIATDIDQEILAVAEANAKAQGIAERIKFFQGDLLEPLEGRRVRYLVSNPPYISDREWQDVPPNVKQYEPEHALRGGVDGLHYLRLLIAQASSYLESPGQLVLEIAASQKLKAIQLAKRSDLTNLHVLADHQELPRVLVADVA